MMKMYTIKVNNELLKANGNDRIDALELVKVDSFNCHQSVINKTRFESAFALEYARKEISSLYVKDCNDGLSEEDYKKLKLLCEYVDIDYNRPSIYDFVCNGTQFINADIDNELKSLFFLTLFAHNIIFSGIDDTDGIKIKPFNFVLLDSEKGKDFYKECAKLIPLIENGNETIENTIEVLKPLYNSATDFINHGASENECKTWIESDKTKDVRRFVTGLLSSYKLTRSNKIKGNSPLKSQVTFEKYLAMWLVTGGKFENKKSKPQRQAETSSSILAKLSVNV